MSHLHNALPKKTGGRVVLPTKFNPDAHRPPSQPTAAVGATGCEGFGKRLRRPAQAYRTSIFRLRVTTMPLWSSDDGRPPRSNMAQDVAPAV